MGTVHGLPPRIAFGAFELNASAGELRKHGVRVRLPDQPLQILQLLLSRPGEIVTREELRECVWNDGTFVDFEHGLYAAMNRLRRALGDSAENARYIETVPGRGYRFIGTLEGVDLRPAAAETPASPAAVRSRFRIERWVIPAAACIVSGALGWWLHAPAERPEWTVTRITSDAGLSSAPAISRDGKLIAYSSDSPDGGTDLYVKQATGGAAVRLTFDGTGNTDPDFSPDGGVIVFRSNRNRGGIYEVPTLGGDARFIAREGRNPKFSPDGSRIAFWIGDPGVAMAVPGSGTVWTVPAAGGEPQQAGRNLGAARYPIWSPNGSELLVIGCSSAKAFDSSALDWWLVSASGSGAIRTGAYAVFQNGLRGNGRFLDSAPDSGSRASIPNVPRPSCWSADDAVTFSARAARADTFDLWRTHVSPLTGRVTGGLDRMTTGAGNAAEVSCSSDNVLAFTAAETRTNIWTVSGDLNAGTVSGALARVTEGPARREYPSMTRDGGQIVFASGQTGPMNIWKRDLKTGAEGEVADSTFSERFPVISSSGEKIAFSSYENGHRTLYVWTRGGTAERVCDGCLRATDWSRDEQRLLVFGGNPYKIGVLDTATHRQTTLLEHASRQLLFARYSPDERWVSFTSRVQRGRSRIMIAPLGGPNPVPEDAWIPVSDEGLQDWALWSPDGRTLYFTSDRDGHSCLWGQRLDPKSHRPVGPAFAVQHIHGRLAYQGDGWSVSGGQFAFALEEQSGNIWLMSRSRRP
jgi:Tol biopolymer transport system component/DNA-binding winged helix-turn-helix (wHTH) protein